MARTQTGLPAPAPIRRTHCGYRGEPKRVVRSNHVFMPFLIGDVRFAARYSRTHAVGGDRHGSQP